MMQAKYPPVTAFNLTILKAPWTKREKMTEHTLAV